MVQEVHTWQLFVFVWSGCLLPGSIAYPEHCMHAYIWDMHLCNPGYTVCLAGCAWLGSVTHTHTAAGAMLGPPLPFPVIPSTPYPHRQSSTRWLDGVSRVGYS